eukprot:m.214051 g.214051  ORF g.214051 m.214051 type:complete len:989 (-) comp16961_c0_seq17:507-3473(-)
MRGKEGHGDNEHTQKATCHGSLDTVKDALARGAPVNGRGLRNQTALHFASFYGRAQVVRLLLDHGADPSLKNDKSQTALDLAQRRKHVRVIQELERAQSLKELGKADTSDISSTLAASHICDPTLLDSTTSTAAVSLQHTPATLEPQTPRASMRVPVMSEICQSPDSGQLVNHAAVSCGQLAASTAVSPLLTSTSSMSSSITMNQTQQPYDTCTQSVPSLDNVEPLEGTTPTADNASWSQLQILQCQFDQLQEENLKLQQQNAQLGDDLTRATQTEQSLQLQLSSTKAELLQLRNTVQDLREELRQLELQETACQARNKALQMAKLKVEQELIGLHQDVEILRDAARESHLASVELDQLASLLHMDLDISRLTNVVQVTNKNNEPIQGSSGKLYTAQLAGHPVALKMMTTSARPTLRSLVNKDASVGDENFKRILQEIRILLSLRHPHLVSFMGLCHEEKASFHTLYVVLSWADQGSLFDFLHLRREKLALVDQFRILAEVANAMHFLHGSGVVHRDLKSPNVLLTAALSAKVCDFGLSAVRHDGQSKMSTVAGTELWASPEQLARKELRQDTDIFSFGCVMWEVFFHTVPWHHIPEEERIIAVPSQFKTGVFLPITETINGVLLTKAQKQLPSGCLQPAGCHVDFGQLWAALEQLQKATRNDAELTAQEQRELLFGSDLAPWKLSPSTLDRLCGRFRPMPQRPSIKTATLNVKDDEDVALLQQMMAEAGSCPTVQNIADTATKSLAAGLVVQSEAKDASFNGCIQRCQIRFCGHLASDTHPFFPTYNVDSNGQATNPEELAVLQHVALAAGHKSPYRVLDPSLLTDHSVRVQRVFHGVASSASVIGILAGDFAHLQKVDCGWYGAGLYFTPDLNYAMAYAHACKPEQDHLDMLMLDLDETKKYRFVLACDVVYGNPKPILAVEDFAGMPLAPGHDAHVAVVNFTTGSIKKATPFSSFKAWRGKRTVAEIAVSDPSCVLVRAVLIFKA